MTSEQQVRMGKVINKILSAVQSEESETRLASIYAETVGCTACPLCMTCNRKLNCNQNIILYIRKGSDIEW